LKIITIEEMGNLLSILLRINTTVIVYKCPPSPSFDFYMTDQFLYEEEPFVILSDPDAEIITIEESDYGYY
jgi:hypothetical protein